jgi:hypothetical protein
MIKRHGERFIEDPDYSKDPTFQRFRNYRSKIGIESDTPFLAGALIQSLHATYVEEKGEKNPDLEEEYRALQQYRKDRREASKLLAWYLINILQYAVRRKTFRVVDSLTKSIFLGRVGFILFLIGFLMWNISKLLSLYLP